MDWEIGKGHVDVNEVLESVKEKCECLTYQLLFCNYVSVVGWSGCDQTVGLAKSLLLIIVWFWSNKFGGDGLRNRRRSCRHKWGLGISERKMWVSCTPVALLQLCECCWLIWMRSNNETYRIPVVAPLCKLRQVNFFGTWHQVLIASRVHCFLNLNARSSLCRHPMKCLLSDVPCPSHATFTNAKGGQQAKCGKYFYNL